jgi:hypothetical protein
MHTIIDSIVANSAIWILVSLILLAPIQTEEVSRALTEAQGLSQAADVLKRAESLGYIDDLARSEGDGPSSQKAMSEIASLVPANRPFALSWSTEGGGVIEALRSGDQADLSYVAIIVTTSTQITHLTLGVGGS